MSGETPISEKVHEKLAKDLFNLTWSLLDKQDRTRDEDLKMIHEAHASRYHWGKIGAPLQFERGDWQISRVYAVLGRSEPALFHAKKCLDICQNNGNGGFDVGFAYEAMARAYAIAGDEMNFMKYFSNAKEAAENIEDEGNRDYFLGELKSIEI